MPHDVISTCPVCANELAVTRLHCRSCGTTLEGDFSVGRFGRLNREQLTLLESFLRSRGNLREMERELGISYPTVRSRVEALVRALGFGPRADADDADDATADAATNAADARGDPRGARPTRDERRGRGCRDPGAREDRAMTATTTGLGARATPSAPTASSSIRVARRRPAPAGRGRRRPSASATGGAGPRGDC